MILRKKIAALFGLTLLLAVVSAVFISPKLAIADSANVPYEGVGITVDVTGSNVPSDLIVTASRASFSGENGSINNGPFGLSKLNSNTYAINSLPPFAGAGGEYCNGSNDGSSGTQQAKMLTFSVKVSDKSGTTLGSHGAEVLNCGNNTIKIAVNGTTPTPTAKTSSLTGIVYVCQGGTIDPDTTNCTGGTLDPAGPITATGSAPQNPLTLDPGPNETTLLSGGSYTYSNLTPGKYTLSGLVTDPEDGVASPNYSFNNFSLTLAPGANTEYVVLDSSDPGQGIITKTKPTSTQTQSDTPQPTCDSTGGPLSWIICGIVDEIGNVETSIEGVIDKLLQTQPISFSATDPTHVFEIWSNFRLYGNIFLVIALLVVVFAEAVGGGVMEAYTVKRMLPRILIAAILINLSIYIVAGLEDIANIIGHSIDALIAAPFQSANAWKISISGISGGIGFSALVGAGAVLWAGGSEAIGAIALFVGLPVLFAIIGVLATLMIREGILIFLVFSSPIAFALYTLPNTEQYFKKWWDLLFKTLMVYPIVSLVFALSNVTAVVMGTLGVTPAWLGQLMGVAARVAPLFLIPFAFKIAGGVISTLHGAISDRAKKTHEGIKGNPNNEFSLRNRVKRGLSEKFSRGQQQMIDKGEGLNASRRRRALSRIVAFTGGNVEGRMSRYNKMHAQMGEDMSATGRDHYRYAAGGYVIEAGEQDSKGKTAGARRFFNSKGEQISGAEYSKGKSLFGNSLSGVGAELEYAVRKAQTPEALSEMRYAFAKNAKANGWSNGEMGDVWAQATYPHKDKWLSEWFSTPVGLNGTDAKGGVKFEDVSTNMKSMDKAINEQHRTKEAFRVGSLRAQDWHAQSGVMMGIQNKIAAGTASKDEIDRYAKISENIDTMVSRGLTTSGADGEPMVAGASAEVQGVIQSMYKNRKYVAAQYQTPTGEYSATDRVLYDRAAADALMRPTAGGAGIDKEAAIKATAVGTANVSSDRSTITNHTIVR